MYVRVRLLTSEDTQIYHINCRSINDSMDELRQTAAQKWLCDNPSLVRLFFDGKELLNGYSLYDYNIKVNNLIQVLIRSEPPVPPIPRISQSTDSISDPIVQHYNTFDKNENFIEEDDYYCIGDYVDALDSDTGAWFGARVAKISSNDSTLEHKYYVNFEKESIGSDITLVLQQIRPQSSKTIPFKHVKEGQLVLANFNSSSTKERGYWYECRIEKKVETNRKLFATICLGTIALKRQRIYFLDDLYEIEINVKRGERSPGLQSVVQFGSKAKRFLAPDCDQCKDDSALVCKKCSCHRCGAKSAPEKQIICDECNAIYHIWCLNTPLKAVPEDDWYCTDCRNSDQNQVLNIQSNQLEKRKKSLNRVGVKEWGRGMACVGRTQICNVVPKDHFGPIPGIEVGMCWRFRFQASEVGIHTPIVAGIHGKENSGAYSVVFSCSYDEDIDLGNEFYYTASGGKDSANKSRVGGPQTKDQELKRCNKALALNCFAQFNDEKGANAGQEWQNGKPVRVLRSGNGRGASKKSLYLPKVGVRYDGIYKVVKYWPQIGESGHLVWRFLLRRDDPTPAPWTKDGINRIKRLKLYVIYPEGWNEGMASKRTQKLDEKAFKPKKLKTSSFSIPKDVLNLIKNDKMNNNLWETVISNAKLGKKEFIESFEMNFKCICCLEVVKSPITTECSHNICKQCLDQSINSGVNCCPICRKVFKNYKNICVNNILNDILCKLMLI